jgi:hypothetical protein
MLCNLFISPPSPLSHIYKYLHAMNNRLFVDQSPACQNLEPCQTKPTQPESGPRAFMSYGTEPRTKTSRPITPDFINKRLSKTYIRRKSCERWDGPIHMSFNTR